MPFHAYNFGVRTSAKGVTYETIRITALNVANGQPCTIAEDVRSNLFLSVTHTATGVYTVQMNLPYPAKIVVCSPELSCSGAATAVLAARYQSASYNATTGQFIVNITNTAGAATDGGATDELHLVMGFRIYTT